MHAEQASPKHYTGEKSEYVREMFAGIAGRYDLLNDVLSFNRHRLWRRMAVEQAVVRLGDIALDVCTGTGDFAMDLYCKTGAEGLVIGSDFCAPMVQLGKQKTDKLSNAKIAMMVGDAQRLPYANDLFDVVTVGFGIRNVTDTQLAFSEMCRVAKPGGRVVCLEFTQPTHWFWKRAVNFYNRCILPIIGSVLSRGEAYKYLPASIDAFYSREELAQIMRRAGLQNIVMTDLNFGSVCIHLGEKPSQ